MGNGIANGWMWAIFIAFVIIALVVDLIALDRKSAQKVTLPEALRWSLLWVSLALLFDGLLWAWLNHISGPEIATQKATEFITGYVIEKSLSVDNIFVFLMIFHAFLVPPEQQKRALIIGVIGAIVLRALMILLGAWLVEQFHWILYLFGAFLLFTGVKMFFGGEEGEQDLELNPILRWMRSHLSMTTVFHGDQLTFLRDGTRWFTPLFAVVVLIAITDVIFAVDSIPAVFAITTDPFIVLTSNIFAILGLRAMFFLLADMADRFHLLKYGLAIVLSFIGAKMLIVDFYKIPIGPALGFVGFVLLASVILSIYTSGRDKPKPH
jgi:tellurite resistance protein TerC